MPPALRIDKLAKRYVVGHETRGSKYRTLRESLVELAQVPLRRFRGQGPVKYEEFWALDDISFEVKPGEVVGIIGRNGAGKSTLLKILSRITKPTRGRVELNGRVGSLLEVGTGFHPELTGRENVFLNGSILGMSKREIERKFDEIVAFAEIEQFLDTPVKRYSSGMYVRLAFAVAAHLEPEILIVDEVLAVGDAAFQKKCLGKMAEVRSTGRSILFVSHNMMAVGALCDTCVLLDRGTLVCHDDVQHCIALYADSGHDRKHADGWTRPETMPPRGLSIATAACHLSGRQPKLTLTTDLSLTSTARHGAAFLAINVVDAAGTPVMQILPKGEGFIRPPAGPLPQTQRLSVRTELPPLIPGEYSISVWVGTHYTETIEMIDHVGWFHVAESPVAGRSFPHCTHHGHVFPASTIAFAEN